MAKHTYTYFVRTGEYGDFELSKEWVDVVNRYPGVGVTGIATTNWTDAMWECIEESKPDRRMELANHISVGIHHWDNEANVCWLCGLVKGDLNRRAPIPQRGLAPAPKAKPKTPKVEPVVLDDSLRSTLEGAVDAVKEQHADEIQATLNIINKGETNA